MSRQQKFMRQALERVQGVHAAGELNEKQKKAFGGICHQVPSLILNNGLGLTVAYLEDKGSRTGSTARPFREVRNCVAGILDVDGKELTEHVANRNSHEYMMATFAVLDAWVFYKRFAVSILNVAAGDTDLSDEDAP